MQIERTDNFMGKLGVEAYRVGGSVRDEILGRRPKDADYMVRGISLPDLQEILHAQDSRIVKITPLKDRQGQQFGWRYGPIEVALPRREENAGEGRRQIIVADPNISLEDDAIRRDFTFNALYKRVDGGERRLTTLPDGRPLHNVYDPTGDGVTDLLHRIVKTTHRNSFRDDPVRILRALRFVAVLGYDLSLETRSQMVTWAERLDGLTANGYTSGTVLDEMSKILMGADVAKALRIARDTGALASIFPELADMLGHDPKSRYHDLTTDEHTFKALDVATKTDAPLEVRWSLLFHDSGKPEVEWTDEKGNSHFYATVMQRAPDGVVEVETEDHEVAGERRWRAAAERIGAPKALRERVAVLIRHHMVDTRGKLKGSKVRKARVKFGDEVLHQLYLHRACDFSAKVKASMADVERIGQMESLRAAAQEAGVPCDRTGLKVNGRDMMDLGIQGDDIGRVLDQLVHEVAVDPSDLKMSMPWQLEAAERLR